MMQYPPRHCGSVWAARGTRLPDFATSWGHRLTVSWPWVEGAGRGCDGGQGYNTTTYHPDSSYGDSQSLARVQGGTLQLCCSVLCCSVPDYRTGLLKPPILREGSCSLTHRRFTGGIKFFFPLEPPSDSKVITSSSNLMVSLSRSQPLFPAKSTTFD